VLRDAHPPLLHRPPSAPRLRSPRPRPGPAIGPTRRARNPPRGRRVLRPRACRPDHRDRRDHVRTRLNVTAEQVGRHWAGSSRRPVPARRSRPRQPSVRREPALRGGLCISSGASISRRRGMRSNLGRRGGRSFTRIGSAAVAPGAGGRTCRPPTARTVWVSSRAGRPAGSKCWGD
jgi:hypothetical protein